MKIPDIDVVVCGHEYTYSHNGYDISYYKLSNVIRNISDE